MNGEEPGRKMHKVVEVKKILRRLDPDGQYDEIVLDVDAREICQIFEPKLRLTDKELLEKIAHKLCGFAECYGECLFYDGEGTLCRNKEPKQILAFIKEAGYVQLADDQSVPQNKYQCSMRIIGEPEVNKVVQEEIKREISIYSEAQQDMLASNFRRIKLEVKEDDKLRESDE